MPEVILDGHASSLQHGIDLGVTILAGSDAGSYAVPHAFGLIDELRLLHEAGMPALDALCLACHTNAARLAPFLLPSSLALGTSPSFFLAPLDATGRPGLLADAAFVFGGRCLPADPEFDALL